MSGKAANAAALLKAGNIQAAEREALAMLDRDPDDRAALDILISAAIEKGDHQHALELAEGWVAREPDGMTAHHNRIIALTLCGERIRAKVALEQYRNDFPLDVAGYDRLRILAELARDDPSDVIRQVEAAREKYGADPDLDKIEAIARSKQDQLFGASRAANRVLERDPANAMAVEIKALNCFKLCRLSKARALARQLRALDPGRVTQANEIILASYAACYPPFFITHLLLIPLHLSKRIPTIFRAVLFFFLGQLIAIPLVIGVEHLKTTTGIPQIEPVIYWSMVAWVLYMVLGFRRISAWRAKQRDVELSSNY